MIVVESRTIERNCSNHKSDESTTSRSDLDEEEEEDDGNEEVIFQSFFPDVFPVGGTHDRMPTDDELKENDFEVKDRRRKRERRNRHRHGNVNGGDIEGIPQETLERKFLEIIDQDLVTEEKTFEESCELRQVMQGNLDDVCRSLQQFRAFPDTKIYPLFMLCALGASRSVLKKCLVAYPDALRHCDDVAGTALHYACSFRTNLKSIKFLLKKDPELACVSNAAGQTPLHIACSRGVSVDVIKLFLEANPKAVKKVDPNAMTSLHMACQSCVAVVHSDAILNALIEAYPKACRMKTRTDSSTPLHIAVRVKAPPRIIKLLVKVDASALREKDEDGCVPLLAAISVKSDLKVLKILVKSFKGGILLKNRSDEDSVSLAETLGYDRETVEYLQNYEAS